MQTFGDARRRLAEYRICLERDVRSGRVPAPAAVAVDECYVSLAGILDEARLQLEAAGPAAQDGAFMGLFVSGCVMLGRRLARAVERREEPGALQALAVEVTVKARELMDHLWMRLERAAA